MVLSAYASFLATPAAAQQRAQLRQEAVATVRVPVRLPGFRALIFDVAHPAPAPFGFVVSPAPTPTQRAHTANSRALEVVESDSL
jgi:hypothetical protein